MNIESKIASLKALYHDYDEQTRHYKKDAVCRPGGSFCCTGMGNIDITTLEGVVISDRIAALGSPLAQEFKDKITANIRAKERGARPACPFLSNEGTCRLYDVRPFSCRQLYSMRECSKGGPLVHRQAMAIAGETVRKIQALDSTGYSGHLSFILHLLGQDLFRKLYLAGGFDPAGIRDFGKSHGIMINCHAG